MNTFPSLKTLHFQLLTGSLPCYHHHAGGGDPRREGVGHKLNEVAQRIEMVRLITPQQPPIDIQAIMAIGLWQLVRPYGHHLKSRCLADDNAPAAKQHLTDAVRIAASQRAAAFERLARTSAA